MKNTSAFDNSRMYLSRICIYLLMFYFLIHFTTFLIHFKKLWFLVGNTSGFQCWNYMGGVYRGAYYRDRYPTCCHSKELLTNCWWCDQTYFCEMQNVNISLVVQLLHLFSKTVTNAIESDISHLLLHCSSLHYMSSANLHL